MNFYHYILPVFFLGIGLSAQASTSLGDFQRLTGENYLDYANRVAAIGDINGDGYEDMAVGAWYEDTAATNAGAVYVIYGQVDTIPSAALSTADAKIVGEASGDNFGVTSVGIGDINSDGYDDFIVGAHKSDRNGTDAGAVYLFYGSATEYTGAVNASSAAAIFIGETSGDSAGDVLAAAGDVNGDGYDDLLISATLLDAGIRDVGGVYLIYGSATIFSGTYTLGTVGTQFTGETFNDAAGSALASGDLNGDDYADLMIGAEGSNSAASDAGTVYVFYGSNSLYSSEVNVTEADVFFTGATASTYAGAGVSSGDINGDGYDDLLIGAERVSVFETYDGAIYLFYGTATRYSGSVSLTTASAVWSGESAYHYLGTALSLADDMNGDGYDDLVIGNHYNSESATGAGAAYVLLGSDAVFSGTNSIEIADIKLVGETANDQAGATIATADMNGDDFPELIVGATSYDDDTSMAGAGAAYIGYLSFETTDTTPPADVTFGATQKDPWNKTITLNWTNPTDVDFDHVIIMRTDRFGTEVVLTETETGTSYIDSSINYGMRYTYTISTVDTTGNVSAGVTTNSKRVKRPTVRHLHLRARDAAIVTRWERLPLRLNPAVGYLVYYGTSPDDLTISIDVGDTTIVTIPELTFGERYYVAVAAYNADGVAGPLSVTKSIQL